MFIPAGAQKSSRINTAVDYFLTEKGGGGRKELEESGGGALNREGQLCFESHYGSVAD